MKQHFIDLMHQLGKNTTEACGLFVDREVRLAWDVYQAAQCRNRAMQAICDGMSAEDMEQAPFTYQSLLQIVQRREDRVPLSALVLPELREHDDSRIGDYDYRIAAIDFYNEAIEDVQRRINQLMDQKK